MTLLVGGHKLSGWTSVFIPSDVVSNDEHETLPTSDGTRVVGPARLVLGLSGSNIGVGDHKFRIAKSPVESFGPLQGHLVRVAADDVQTVRRVGST